MKILVNDNPSTGACDVVDHWQEVLKGLNTFNGAIVEYNDNATEDSVIILDDLGDVIETFIDGDALRFDLIQEEVSELDIATISWEDFKKKYAV